jgi:hypothetical protein
VRKDSEFNLHVRHDTQHCGIQHNGNQYNDIRHYDILQISKENGTLNLTLSVMMSVENKPFMLSVIVLNVVMLSVVAL